MQLCILSTCTLVSRLRENSPSRGPSVHLCARKIPNSPDHRGGGYNFFFFTPGPCFEICQNTLDTIWFALGPSSNKSRTLTSTVSNFKPHRTPKRSPHPDERWTTKFGRVQPSSAEFSKFRPISSQKQFVFYSTHSDRLNNLRLI